MENLSMDKDIEYFYDINQLTDEWLQLKLGILSASILKNVITAKTLKVSASKTNRLFYDEILAQRIDGEIDRDSFTSYAMQRGLDDEPYAIKQYEDEYGKKVRRCGFVINKTLGFPFGYSPDGLVGDDGLIEIKSREPKYQIQTILDHMAGRSEDIIPSEFMMQIQTGLFVSGRKWCDFISFCNGFQMVRIRVYPIPDFQEAIKEAASDFEDVLEDNMKLYQKAVKENEGLTPTTRRKINTGDISV